MDRRADAFGRALLDWARGGSDLEIYEREDGFIEAGAGPELYLAGSRHWPAPERKAVRLARGRVLDVGCGAGRVSLHLQQRGLDVVAADASALALQAARLLGVKRRWCVAAVDVGPRLAEFDTVVLYGNNFGIFGTPERVRRALLRWARYAAPGTRLLAESTDPAGGAPAFDAAYRRRNVELGRMPGQLRLRIRYRDLATAWFSWLFVSPADMGDLVRGTGWKVARVFVDDPALPYVAVLERQGDQPKASTRAR